MLCNVCMYVRMSVCLYVCLYVCMYVSLHFPFAPQYSPQKTRFFQHARKEDVQKHRVLPDFRQKDAGSPSQQKSRQGESSLGPLFCDIGSLKATFSGTSSNCRAVLGGGGGPTYQTSGLGVRHAEQCRRIFFADVQLTSTATLNFITDSSCSFISFRAARKARAFISIVISVRLLVFSLLKPLFFQCFQGQRLGFAALPRPTEDDLWKAAPISAPASPVSPNHQSKPADPQAHACKKFMLIILVYTCSCASSILGRALGRHGHRSCNERHLNSHRRI